MKSASTTSRRRVSADEALALWSEYKRTGDVQVRNRLVMTFAPLVKYIVFKKVRELPARCEVEDFISCGLEALIASIDRYDPEKGATLEQFAWTRIHGAVLDELRRQDWAPRSLRRWERDIHKAREQFTSLHGRRPSREEAMCQALNPAIPSSQIAASAPPATITSASPSWISRVPSPIACAPVEQAVTTAWFGPLKP